ncbi:myosin-H heavy chain-like protein [Trifolium pratense]|uniref:Myosin-H heavy chain-like protein n=1 Tax=Trifolium pratense TaxID=57577 RepID=A0A2K3M7U1_TRIPR|nr:myosin-H heavy chain-like protein [Trifolium pratense]
MIRSFDEFVDRFGLLAPEALDGSSDEVNACNRILKNVRLEGYQIGKTKAFLRAGQMAELDTRRSEILGKSASIIQMKVRSYLARRSFVLLRLSAVQIQAACRGQIARQVFEGMQREASSLLIQRHFRMPLLSLSRLKAAIATQCAWRGKVARREHRKLKMAAR